jgi:hypothetical protein
LWIKWFIILLHYRWSRPERSNVVLSRCIQDVKNKNLFLWEQKVCYILCNWNFLEMWEIFLNLHHKSKSLAAKRDIWGFYKIEINSEEETIEILINFSQKFYQVSPLSCLHDLVLKLLRFHYFSVIKKELSKCSFSSTVPFNLTNMALVIGPVVATISLNP